MAKSRATLLNEVLRPKAVRLWLALVAFVGAYDTFATQFGFSEWTLRRVIGMSGALLPIWGWAMLFVVGLYYALFEYVRVSLPQADTSSVEDKAEANRAYLKYGETTRTDWTPWKHMPVFTVTQLAKILAKDDPASPGITTAASAYRNLIIADAESGNLKARAKYQFTTPHHQVAHDISINTEVDRSEALRWAHSKSFSLVHIE